MLVTDWAEVAAKAAIVYDILTLGLVGVGGGAIFVAWKQLGALRDQSKAAETATQEQTKAIREQIRSQEEIANRQLRLSLRPKITIESGFSDGITGTFSVRNVGAGPALHIELRAWLLPMDDGFDAVEHGATLSELSELMSRDVNPHAAYHIGGLATGQAVEREALLPKSKSGFAMGGAVASYSDVFGESRRETFSFGIRPNR